MEDSFMEASTEDSRESKASEDSMDSNDWDSINSWESKNSLRNPFNPSGGIHEIHSYQSKANFKKSLIFKKIVEVSVLYELGTIKFST